MLTPILIPRGDLKLLMSEPVVRTATAVVVAEGHKVFLHTVRARPLAFYHVAVFV